jgi:hypothetical protein
MPFRLYPAAATPQGTRKTAKTGRRVFCQDQHTIQINLPIQKRVGWYKIDERYGWMKRRATSIQNPKSCRTRAFDLLKKK